MSDQIIASLIDRLLNGSITPEEKELLAKWILHDSDEKELSSMVERAWRDFKPGQTLPAEKADELLGSILRRGKEEDGMAWWRRPVRAYQLAAAVLLFVIVTGAGIYFLRKQSGPAPIAIAGKEAPAPGKDVAAPSASNAVLTLSDGKKILLDSADQGNIATQRATAIVKVGDGDIAYKGGGAADEVVYNTLTVPVGSRIAHITLSDGTKVWLNAGSSLHYPVVFNGPDRKVTVTGETYFEVAQDAAHTFVVSKGTSEIKVLGTHFNVNAYDDEGEIKVTLLEGAVRVAAGTGNRLLSPGQMATIDARQKIDVLKNINLERVMAWKNGYFDFASADIRTVMRELARWYGLDLVWGDVITEKFHVEINRDIPLSKVLRILEMTGRVHFNISGNKVTVMH